MPVARYNGPRIAVASGVTRSMWQSLVKLVYSRLSQTCIIPHSAENCHLLASVAAEEAAAAYAARNAGVSRQGDCREFKIVHKLQGGDALCLWAVCVPILRMILSEKSATFRDHAEPPCKKVRNGGALRQKTENLFSMTNAVSDAANRPGLPFATAPGVRRWKSQIVGFSFGSTEPLLTPRNAVFQHARALRCWCPPK